MGATIFIAIVGIAGVIYYLYDTRRSNRLKPE
jgi:uncharacterized membrane protein YuzA (DUF378 family)